MNPSSAQAIIAPKTPTVRVSSQLDRIANGVTVAIIMMMPPIVGVPALVEMSLRAVVAHVLAELAPA